jgi:hypothetical protein
VYSAACRRHTLAEAGPSVRHVAVCCITRLPQSAACADCRKQPTQDLTHSKRPKHLALPARVRCCWTSAHLIQPPAQPPKSQGERSNSRQEVQPRVRLHSTPRGHMRHKNQLLFLCPTQHAYASRRFSCSWTRVRNPDMQSKPAGESAGIRLRFSLKAKQHILTA